MAACAFSDDDLTPNQGTVVHRESGYINNDFNQLPTVTVRDARSLSISSATSKNSSNTSSSSSESYSPASSPASSPISPSLCSTSSERMEQRGRGSSNHSSSTNMSDKSDVHLELDSLDTGVSQMREKFEDLSSNNNNLHFTAPTKDKLRYSRRNLVRSSSSACSSISENMEDEGSEEESDADQSFSSTPSSPSPRNRPPLQRSSAIRVEEGFQSSHLSPRSVSPISPVEEELETYSGIKTVVRRPKKSQNGRSSPSWRWSVMGVANGDYDAIVKATPKGRHPPPVSTSTPAGSNVHTPLSRRSSIGMSTTPTSALVSPRTNKLSTEFRRLSLQMDMPWRDPNERLVKFADWLIKRTEELMERSALARQKTSELLRLARNRQRDPMEY